MGNNASFKSRLPQILVHEREYVGTSENDLLLLGSLGSCGVAGRRRLIEEVQKRKSRKLSPYSFVLNKVRHVALGGVSFNGQRTKRPRNLIC